MGWYQRRVHGAHTFHLLIVERTNNSKTKTMKSFAVILAAAVAAAQGQVLLPGNFAPAAGLPLAYNGFHGLAPGLLPPQLSTLRLPLLPPSLPLSQLLASSQLPPRPTLSHQQGSSTSQLSLNRSTRPLSNTDTRSSTKSSP